MNRLRVVEVQFVINIRKGEHENITEIVIAKMGDGFISSANMKDVIVAIIPIMNDRIRITYSMGIPVIIDNSPSNIGTALGYDKGNRPKYDKRLASHLIS